MKSYLALLITIVLAFCASANAGEPYYYGDGTPAFELQTPTDLARAIDPQAGPLLVEDSREIPLTETLGARGDVIYLDADGAIVLRQALNRSATYYKNPDDMGRPVLRRRDTAMLAAENAPITLDEWGRAYAYQGQAKKGSKNTADKTSAKPKIN